MCSDIDQRTAALFGLVREYAPGRNRSSSDCMCFCEVNITQFSFLACTFQHLSVCTETVLITDRKFLAGFLPCIHHLLCIFCCCSHRFLTENMFACLKCSHRDRAVCHVRCADMYNIDILIFEHFIIVFVNLSVFCSVFFCRFLRSLSDDIAECHDLTFISL